jgi:hypothetical protein
VEPELLRVHLFRCSEEEPPVRLEGLQWDRALLDIVELPGEQRQFEKSIRTTRVFAVRPKGPILDYRSVRTSIAVILLQPHPRRVLVPVRIIVGHPSGLHHAPQSLVSTGSRWNGTIEVWDPKGGEVSVESVTGEGGIRVDGWSASWEAEHCKVRLGIVRAASMPPEGMLRLTVVGESRPRPIEIPVRLFGGSISSDTGTKGGGDEEK